MSDTLVVNPYLRLEPIGDGSAEFILSAAKRNAGLQSLTISRETQSNLFELFSDLASTRFDFLDSVKDVSSDECELLRTYGVLVTQDDVPKLPCFACNLDEVEPDSNNFDSDSLYVNPTFRYEPFDLLSFAATLHEKHLSPYQPSAWIRTEVTEIEMGCWLSPEQGECVSQFEAGKTPDTKIDDPLLRKLIAARLLVSDETIEADARKWSTAVERARSEFASNGYAVVRSLLPAHQMAAMRRFYRQYVNEGFMPFGDNQVSGRYRQHNEPLAMFLHQNLHHLMSLVVGSEVKLSYVYAASYKDGAILDPHTDREQCEYSISFQVDYEPEPDDQISPWAIYVEPLEHDGPLPSSGVSRSWDQTNIESAAALHLANGDGLFYKGRELVHYRQALPAGHRSTSLFFHFVPADFEGYLG
jgi:hypothetical protein